MGDRVLKFALVNPAWDFHGSIYFGCQEPHYPLELLFAFDQIQATGPWGSFIFRQPAEDSVLVAAGTGIVPFRAMLREQLARDSSHLYTLLYGVRYERGLLYRREFEEVARTHPNFRFWPTLSRPEPNWTGRTGHVQAHLFDATGDRRDVNVFVCGLKAMVDDVRSILKAAGFDRKRILCEKYD